MSNKEIFRTAYSGQIRKTAPTGTGIQNEYGYEIDKFGRKILVKTGETNLYAKIQESLEETKIENILKRVAIGDTTVMRPDGIYADLTEMPNNLIEARQAMQELENLWNSLDNDIKRKYNFDLDQFIGQSGKDEWLRDIGLLQEEVKKVETPKTEVKEETPNE